MKQIFGKWEGRKRYQMNRCTRIKLCHIYDSAVHNNVLKTFTNKKGREGKLSGIEKRS